MDYKDKYKKDCEFNKRLSEWLEPHGFSSIYDNHPCTPVREFHYIKNGVRIVCVNDPESPYCYVYADIIYNRDITYAVRTTMRHKIGTDKVIESHTLVRGIIREQRSLYTARNKWYYFIIKFLLKLNN